MKPDSGRLDLERLQSTDGPELHRALDALKQQLPDPKQLAALAASLTQLGLPIAPSSQATATAATGSSATRLKLLLGAGVVGPLTLALLLWRSTAPQVMGPSPVPVASPETPAAHAALETPQRIPEGSSGVSKPPASVAASDGAPSRPPLPSSQAIDPPAIGHEPQSAASPEPVRVAARAATAPRASVESARSPLAPDHASHESVGQGVVARPTEVALLRDARLALGSDPAQAFALAEQHRALFAHGAMVQERELIAISALSRMGRHAAVLARAAQFERDFPNSPYRKQVSALAQ